MAEPGGGRGTFGPVVLGGLASSGLVAISANQPWWTSEASGGAGDATAALLPTTDLTPQVPLTLALSLVSLAAWGVVLVTRGRVRRVVAGLALLGAAGSLVASVVGAVQVPDRLRAAAVAGSSVEVSVQAWYPVALVAGVLAVLAAAAGVRRAPAWPEMGRRYDAPGAAGAGGASAVSGRPAGGPGRGPDERPDEEPDNLGLWKAIDEGGDPTA